MPKDYCKKKCEITKSYKPLKPIAVFSDGSYSYYNITYPTEPAWKVQSDLIKNASTTRGKKIIYSNVKINEYESYAGAPSGYGAPPRNTFV